MKLRKIIILTLTSTIGAFSSLSAKAGIPGSIACFTQFGEKKHELEKFTKTYNEICGFLKEAMGDLSKSNEARHHNLKNEIQSVLNQINSEYQVAMNPATACSKPFFRQTLEASVRISGTLANLIEQYKKSGCKGFSCTKAGIALGRIKDAKSHQENKLSRLNRNEL